MTSVFLSSAMSGMEVFREAAKGACDSIDIDVVRAEDFAAHAGSPRGACLREVANTSGVILLIGSNYGTSLGSGVSATEEEFNEAIRIGKDIFVFRVADELQPKQRDFLDRVGQWQGGRSYRLCKTPVELQRDVVRTLQAWSSAPSRTDVDAAVRRNLVAVTPQDNHGHMTQGGPWISLSWVPSQRLVLDEDFVFEVLPDVAADQLVSGSSRILRTRPQSRPHEHGFEIRSESGQRPELRGWIGVDGSVAVGLEIQAIESEAKPSPMGASFYYLPPKDIHFMLARMFEFVGRMIKTTDPDHRCSAGRMLVSLSRLGMKVIGEPEIGQQSFQIPILDQHKNRATVPSDPAVVVRSRLAVASPDIDMFVKKICRVLGSKSH